MQDQAMAFSNRTGNELFRLLVQRARDELPAQSGGNRNTAMLGAALITVAEVLRESVERAKISISWSPLAHTGCGCSSNRPGTRARTGDGGTEVVRDLGRPMVRRTLSSSASSAELASGAHKKSTMYDVPLRRKNRSRPW